MPAKTQALIVIAVILGLSFTALTVGQMYFANAGLGERAFASPTPNAIVSWPPIEQTVWARAFPTTHPNVPVAPPKQSPPPLPPHTPGPDVPSDVPQRAAGAGLIVEITGGARLNHGYSVVNEWFAKTASEKIWAFAGGIWDEPFFASRFQGFVSVEYYALDSEQQTRPEIIVNTPTPTGALEIVDAKGMVLELKSEQDVRYFFDVEGGKFVP